MLGDVINHTVQGVEESTYISAFHHDHRIPSGCKLDNNQVSSKNHRKLRVVLTDARRAISDNRFTRSYNKSSAVIVIVSRGLLRRLQTAWTVVILPVPGGPLRRTVYEILNERQKRWWSKHTCPLLNCAGFRPPTEQPVLSTSALIRSCNRR
jgi:hypothetical protein